MLCESCNKNNATLHFTKIINGNVEAIHLCESCAKESDNFDFPLSLGKIFTGLISGMQGGKTETKNITCEKCGLTYNRFLEIGKFGCSDCYDAFREDINPLVKGIHGHITHKGKVLEKIKNRNKDKEVMEDLKKQLEESIKLENFEQAAVLRDEIKKIKSKMEPIGE